MGAKTIQEFIDILQQVKDKTQTLNAWDRYGYYGTNLSIEIATDQDENPLIIKTNLH